MIVTCPACSASYMVQTDDIGSEGRNVRCRKCKHVWFHESEKKIIDELITRIQESEIEVDDLYFGDLKKPAKAKNKGISLSTLIKRLLNKLPKLSFLSMDKQYLLKLGASFMVALALFSLIGFAGVFFRGTIVKAAPSLAPLYVGAGFPLVAYADVNPEDFLVIENKNIEIAHNKRVVHASLINLSSKLIRVPHMLVSYFDKEDKLLLTDKRSFSFSIMPKEFTHSFHFSLPEKISNDVKIIRFSFTE